MAALPPELLAAIVRVTDGDEAAARDLARRWQTTLRECEQRAERIRRQVADAECRCATPADTVQRDRCGRCFGRVASEGASG